MAIMSSSSSRCVRIVTSIIGFGLIVPDALEPLLSQAALAAGLHAHDSDYVTHDLARVVPVGASGLVVESRTHPQLHTVLVPADDGTEATLVLTLSLLHPGTQEVHVDHVLDLEHLTARPGPGPPAAGPDFGDGPIVGVGRVLGQLPYLPGLAPLGQHEVVVADLVGVVPADL